MEESQRGVGKNEPFLRRSLGNPGLSKGAKALLSVVINHLVIVSDDGVTLTAAQLALISQRQGRTRALLASVVFYHVLADFPPLLPPEGFLAAALLKIVPLLLFVSG